MLAGALTEQDSDSGELPDLASAASASDSGAASSLQHPAGPGPSKLSLTAKLGEVALFVSGRAAEVWWPAEVRHQQGV